MEQLIAIKEENGKRAVSARDLHAALEIKKQFAAWIEYQIESMGLIEAEDFSPILVKSTGGRPSVEYALTIETAKHLAMATRTEKGKQVRAYFIECEKKLSTVTAVPQTLPEALRMAADLAEANQKLLPKAQAYDQFIDSANYKSVGVVGKALGLGQKRLFKWLRDNNILMGNNVPYQRYIDAGYFVVKEKPITMGECNYNYSQTFITAKGEAWLSTKGIA